MMKSLTSVLIALLSLAVLAATTYATEAPTLDDTMVEDMTTTSTAPAEEAEPSAAPAPVPEEAAPILVNVTEMVIAKEVVDREPVGAGTTFSTDTERLYCHSRIASITPATITHVWYRDGERVADIPLRIGAASSWRTWSSKAIFPPVPASWRVEILAEDGTLLAETDFTIE